MQVNICYASFLNVIFPFNMFAAHKLFLNLGNSMCDKMHNSIQYTVTCSNKTLAIVETKLAVFLLHTQLALQLKKTPMQIDKPVIF